MKLKDLLLEFRERIDRTYYGQWVDSNTGKIYPIENEQGHQQFIRSNPELFGIDDTFKIKNPYEPAYAKGFVRIAHPKPNMVFYSALSEPLRIASPIIMGTAAQRDVDYVLIDKLDHPSDEAGSYERFSPRHNAGDAAKLREFLEGS